MKGDLDWDPKMKMSYMYNVMYIRYPATHQDGVALFSYCGMGAGLSKSLRYDYWVSNSWILKDYHRLCDQLCVSGEHRSSSIR